MSIREVKRGPMITPTFEVGERVVSFAGWSGTVTRVRKFPSGTRYKIKWDQNGYEGWLSPCNLRKAVIRFTT
jgi:hypothetical protein